MEDNNVKKIVMLIMDSSRAFLLFVLLLLLLSACQNNQPLDSQVPQQTNQKNDQQSELRRIRDENMTLQGKINLLEERPSEKFMSDLRETMNLSHKIILAMGVKDYSYLESVSAPGVTINKDENKVYFDYGGKKMDWDFLKTIELNKLEYWSSFYLNGENEFQIDFAHFWGDSHGTIEIYFVKIDGSWLFNGFITNA
jgi:hypothetical protein